MKCIVLAAGYATNAGQLRTGQMDSLLDFDFNDQAISFVSGNLSTVENFMESRNAGIDNTATMGSFLSSHDEDGLMYRLMNEGSRVDSDKAHALMKVASTLQITAKGQTVTAIVQSGKEMFPNTIGKFRLVLRIPVNIESLSIGNDSGISLFIIIQDKPGHISIPCPDFHLCFVIFVFSGGQQHPSVGRSPTFGLHP